VCDDWKLITRGKRLNGEGNRKVINGAREEEDRNALEERRGIESYNKTPNPVV